MNGGYLLTAYHGTIVGGLTLSSLYIWNRDYKWLTFEIREDGMPIYNEAFKNCLLELYGGVKGYIYTCVADFETDENTNIKHAVISKEPVNVPDIDIVDNAYERILQYEKDGMIIINRFENLSDKQKNATEI